jgi:hypothetical protein
MSNSHPLALCSSNSRLQSTVVVQYRQIYILEDLTSKTEDGARHSAIIHLDGYTLTKH